MRNLILFGMLVLFLVAVQFASAQSVDDIISKNVNARGGQAKLDSIKSVYMEGTREMMGTEVDVNLTKEQGKLSRTEFEIAGSKGFLLITNKGAWSYFPMHSQEVTKFPDSAAAAMQSELDIAGPLVDYIAKGNKAELLGKDTLDGNENYKIQITTAAGKEITYWIDAKTYLISQTSQKGGGMFGGGRKNGNDEVTLQYKDYSPVDGIQFAHSIITKAPGSPADGTAMTFDKIEINPPVDPKLYNPE